MRNQIILNSKNYNEIFLKYFPQDYWNLSENAFNKCYGNIYKYLYGINGYSEISTTEIRISINDDYHIQIWKKQSIEFRNNSDGDFIKTYGINGINYSYMTNGLIYYFFDEEGKRHSFNNEKEFRNYIKKTPYTRLEKLKRILDEE